MKHRLENILVAEKLASSKFADILGVNRSSISHLLSGRNNPGLDFLQKVLVKFPHINPDWLLLGQGSMYRNAKGEILAPATNQNLFSIVSEQPMPKESTQKVTIERPSEHLKMSEQAIGKEPSIPKEASVHKVESSVSKETILNKQTERIVIFYTDGTFDNYLPNENRKK